MTEGTSGDSKYAELEKRIEHQARFTRTVVVACTAAILGTMFYMLTEIYSSLPTVIVGRISEMKIAEESIQSMKDKSGGAQTPAPAHPAQ